MRTKSRSMLFLLMLLVGLLPACSHPAKFVAPEIEPPADLIPSYAPDGFELVTGFKLPGKIPFPATSDRGDVFRIAGMDPINLKSPKGNDIQGVYYQGKEHLILITKSYFPQGTLDLWRSTFEASGPEPCECEWPKLRPNAEYFSTRLVEIQEERTVNGTHVAILKGPLGQTTVFVRGDYLLTVESGIALDENLKIVASLIEN